MTHLKLVIPPAEPGHLPEKAEPRDLSFEWLGGQDVAHELAHLLVGEAIAAQASHLADPAAMEVVLVGQGSGLDLSWL